MMELLSGFAFKFHFRRYSQKLKLVGMQQFEDAVMRSAGVYTRTLFSSI
jgi:hypothetical protein